MYIYKPYSRTRQAKSSNNLSITSPESIHNEQNNLTSGKLYDKNSEHRYMPRGVFGLMMPRGVHTRLLYLNSLN